MYTPEHLTVTCFDLLPETIICRLQNIKVDLDLTCWATTSCSIFSRLIELKQWSVYTPPDNTDSYKVSMSPAGPCSVDPLTFVCFCVLSVSIWVCFSPCEAMSMFACLCLLTIVCTIDHSKVIFITPNVHNVSAAFVWTVSQMHRLKDFMPVFQWSIE